VALPDGLPASACLVDSAGCGQAKAGRHHFSPAPPTGTAREVCPGRGRVRNIPVFRQNVGNTKIKAVVVFGGAVYHQR